MSTAPLGDPQTMPLGDLRAELNDPQPAPVVPAPEAAPAPAPVAPAIPEQFSVQQGTDGITIQMAPEFGGETFKGKDWSEVGPKIAKAKADANAYIKTLKATPAAPADPVAPAQPTQEELADKQVQEWLIEQTARGLGLSKEEYKSRMQRTFETTEKMAVNTEIAEFHKICPGYTDTPENSAALTEYCANLDHFPTAFELKQAYAMAVLDGKIQSAQAPAGAPRTPPPMPGNTVSTGGGANEWTMPKDDLKRLAGLG